MVERGSYTQKIKNKKVRINCFTFESLASYLCSRVNVLEIKTKINYY